MTYTQCVLEKTTLDGMITTISWIPSAYAVVGAAIKLKNDGIWTKDDGIWTKGWVVAFVWQTVDEKELCDQFSLRSLPKRK